MKKSFVLLVFSLVLSASALFCRTDNNCYGNNPCSRCIENVCVNASETSQVVYGFVGESMHLCICGARDECNTIPEFSRVCSVEGCANLVPKDMYSCIGCKNNKCALVDSCGEGKTCSVNGKCIECSVDSECNDGFLCISETCVNNTIVAQGDSDEIPITLESTDPHVLYWGIPIVAFIVIALIAALIYLCVSHVSKEQ